MDCILCAIGTESCSNRIRLLCSCYCCVGRSNDVPPLLNGASSDKLEADTDVATHKSGKIGEERLSTVLSVELSSCFRSEASHL